MIDLHARYISADLPRHGEKYPDDLRGIWRNYQHLDPQFAPNYYRIDKDHFVCYERIDRDNYSLQVTYRGEFVCVADAK